jgi:hypothetical protein
VPIKSVILVKHRKKHTNCSNFEIAKDLNFVIPSYDGATESIKQMSLCYAQFYIQLVYKPHFGTFCLGPFGHLKAAREKNQFEVVLATQE